MSRRLAPRCTVVLATPQPASGGRLQFSRCVSQISGFRSPGPAAPGLGAKAAPFPPRRHSRRRRRHPASGRGRPSRQVHLLISFHGCVSNDGRGLSGGVPTSAVKSRGRSITPPPPALHRNATSSHICLFIVYLGADVQEVAGRASRTSSCRSKRDAAFLRPPPQLLLVNADSVVKIKP